MNDPTFAFDQEEDKLKIMWGPADIERWLQTGKKSSSNERAIEIDRCVTICVTK